MAFIAIVVVVAAVTAALLLLFPGQKTPGAQRRDIELTDSAYGRFLPIGRGRVRISGDLVWGRKVRAKEVKAQGGKGGGGGGASGYEYFGDFIYAISDASIFGPAKAILQVWANSNLIYDVTGSSELDVKEGVTLRFMLGEMDQAPDIMQVEDENKWAQGHPGTILVALENFALEHSSNNVPQLSAVVDYEKASGDLEYTAGPNSALQFANDRKLFVDYGGGKLFITEEIPGSSDTFIHEYNLQTQAYVQELSLAAATNGSSVLSGIDKETGRIYGWDSDINDWYWQVFDPATGTFITDVVWTGNPLTEVFGIGETQWALITNVAKNKTVAMSNDHATAPSGEMVFFHDSVAGALVAKFARPSGFNTGTHPVTGALGEGYTVVWSTTELRVMQYTLSDLGAVTENLLATLTPAQISATSFTGFISANPALHYDPLNRMLLFQVAVNGSGAASRWVGFDINTSSLVWAISLTSATASAYFSRMQTRLNGGFLVVQADTTDELISIDILTGATVNFSTGHNWLPFLEKNMFFDGVTKCMYGPQNNTPNQQLDKYCFGVGDGFVALQDILREICTRLKLTEGTDFDVSAVTGGPWGWVLDKRQSGASAIKKVLAYFYTLVGTQDGKVVFRDRGEASSGTIDIGHFVVTSEDKVPWTITQADFEDLPSGAEVEFMDPNRDYEPGLAEHHRNNFPDVVIERPKPISLKGDVAMTADQAGPIAYNLTYMPWKETDIIKGKLPFWYIKLVANDAVDIDFGDGNPLRARVKKADWTSDGVVDFEAVFEEAGALTASEFATSTGTFFRTGALQASEPSAVQFLDINLLRDTDDLGQTGANTYAGLTGAVNPLKFSAGTLFRTDDGLNYVDLFQTTTGILFGVTDTLLSTPLTPWGTKFGDFVDVQFIDEGENPLLIQSITYSALLNDANPLVILKAGGLFEIIQYMTVTDLGAGKYRLSDLLRGRRGTDTMVGGNAIGDTIVLPTLESLRRFSTLPGALGTSKDYRAVTQGALFESAADQPFTVTGNDLKPYAPVLPVLTRPVDDILGTFKRRPRIGTGVALGVWVHPLAEATEAYEIDIKDGPAGTVVRTLAVSTPAFTYLSADQITDGFTGAETSMTFEVFQMSAIVGRGYSYEYTEEIG